MDTHAFSGSRLFICSLVPPAPVRAPFFGAEHNTAIYLGRISAL